MRELRSVEEVYWKAQAWAGICERAFVERDHGRPVAISRKDEILQNASLNEFELEYFTDGRLSGRQLDAGTWYCEPLAAAQFIMGISDNLPYDSDISMLGPIERAQKQLLEDASFRPEEEIQSTMQMLFWVHRRVFAYFCKHQKVDTVAWAKACNVSLESLVEVQEDDISFSDEPLFMKGKQELPYDSEFPKVTGSRLNVFRWAYGEEFEGGIIGTLSSPYRMYEKDKCDWVPLYNIETAEKDITGPDQPFLPAGGTPLMVAVSKKDFDKMETYSKTEGALEQTDINGMTPLVLAVYMNCTETVEKLLDLGADVDGIDGQNRYPLIVALHSGFNGVAELLIKRGAGVDGPAGTDPPMFDLVRERKPEGMKLLLENGARVDERNSHLRTPLMIAALKNHLEEVEILLGYDPVLKYEDGDKNTAMHFACRYGSTDIVKRLIEAGHDLELKNQKNMTPMAFATFYGHRDAAIACLEAGAEIEIEAVDGQSPIHYSCLFEDVELTAKLIEKGADVNKVSKDGYTAVSAAVAVKSAELLKLLLDAGAEVKGKDLEGMSPLHVAVNNGDVESTKLILAKNPSLEEKSEHGHTPLLAACIGRDPEEVVNLLIDQGVQVDSQDKEGYTALHYMAARGIKSSVLKLLEAKASTSIESVHGHTAKQLAKLQKQPEMADLI